MAKRNYTLLKKGNDYVAVKNGLSWPAFFFTPLWALFKLPMYGLAIVTTVFLKAVILTKQGYTDMDAPFTIFDIALFFFWLFLFSQGNEFRVERFVRKKYKIIKKKVFAKSQDEAVKKITGREPTKNSKGDWVYEKKKK